MSIVQEALKKAQNYIDEQKASQKENIEEPKRNAGISDKKRHKIIPLFFAGFIILSIFAVKQFLPLGKFRLTTPPAKSDPVDAASRQEVSYKAITPRIEPVPLPDPTPLHEIRKVTSAPNLVLNGIMYFSDGPQAVINGSRVAEGGIIGGAKVVRINKNNVVLNLDDLEITLNLKE